MLRANAPVFVPGAPRFPVAATTATPKLPQPLEDILRAVTQLPASARRAALGPMLDALDADRENELAEALSNAENTGDKRLALVDLSDELRARKDALSASPLTHRELLDALSASFPTHSTDSLALAALLLPAELQARILKSHASIFRGLIAGSSAQAAAETIGRATKKADEDSPPLAAQLEQTLADLPSLEQAHPQAMRFLAQQATRLQEENTPVCHAPRAAFEGADQASGEDMAPLLEQHDAIRALCRAEGSRLEGTAARALLDHATESLGARVLAYRNLENYCKALGLNDPAHLPADLIAASRLDGAERKKKMRDLVRRLPAHSQAALSRQLLDRSLKPSAQLKTLLTNIRAHGKDAEKALATVLESLQQQLASLARAPRKDAKASEDALIEEAIQAAQREKEQAAPSAPTAPPPNPNREKLRAALRAHRGSARDLNTLFLARVEAQVQRAAEQVSAPDWQNQYGESLIKAIDDLKARNLDLNNPLALEQHIGNLSEHEIMKLLTDTERLVISIAEGVAQRLFPPEAQIHGRSMPRIFSAAKRMAHTAQPIVTVSQGRDRLNVTLDRLIKRGGMVITDALGKQDLIDSLLACMPMGAVWARTIDIHRDRPNRVENPQEEGHIDWSASVESYQLISDQIKSIPLLGNDIFVSWMKTNQRYLDTIGPDADVTLTPAHSRLLEKMTFEEAEALASHLGPRLKLLAKLEVNAAMTYVTTMSRVKAQSESLTSPAAFCAWCLTDALFQADWNDKDGEARVAGLGPSRPDTPSPDTPASPDSGSAPSSPSQAGPGAGDLQFRTVTGILSAFSNVPRQNHGA